jgi:alpha-tubulin suppressor-like RCC1 family protein
MAGACDGAGACTGMTTSCAPYACDSAACKTSCASSADCIADAFCWLGACVKVSAVAASYYHTCALTTAGGVQCWGWNMYGQLGNGTTTDSDVPVAVSGLSSGVVAISVGYGHSCALTAAGGVVCWGENDGGGLGNNSTTSSLAPVAVTGLPSTVVAVAAGGSDFTCALTSTGGVLCWGGNHFGTLGNGTTTDSLVPVPVSGLSSGVAAISAGTDHTCAVTTAGGLQCWGNNGWGQLGNNYGPPNYWYSNVPTAVPGLASGVAAVTAAGSHTCALTTAGGVSCWGSNTYGELGNNTTGQDSVPVAVVGLSSGVAAIIAGDSHSCALMTGGSVQCWGAGLNGEFGNNSTNNSLVPVAALGLSSGVTAITAGTWHTCALLTTGRLECCGANDRSELGDNSTALYSAVPVSVAEP